MNGGRVTFNQVNIVSGDMAATIEFYRRLGIEIPESAIWRTPSGAHHVSAVRSDDGPFLDLDSAAFAQIWNTGWSGATALEGRTVVGFGVTSREAVDEIYADVTGAGYRGLQAPFDAFWGARYAIIESPDGIAVGLMSPISPHRKSPSPAV
jgi:catechol 2,3-dioxygenase-like lactoylglutathione lyase family enzyme